jgi:hypothetical protein
VSAGVTVSARGEMIELELPENSTAVILFAPEALEVAARIVALVGDDDLFQKYLAKVRDT